MVPGSAGASGRRRGHRPRPRAARAARPPGREVRARGALEEPGVRAQGARLARGHPPRDHPDRRLRALPRTPAQRHPGHPAGDAAAVARAPHQDQGSRGAVVGRTVVGGVRARADRLLPGVRRGHRVRLHPADHRGDRTAAGHRRAQLPADDQGVSQGRRLVHRRQRQPRAPRRADRGLRPDDVVHADRGGVGRRRHRQHHQRRPRRHPLPGSPVPRVHRAAAVRQPARHP